MLGSGFVINISLFQMVPPTIQKDTTTGQADKEGPCFGGKGKIKSRIKHLFPLKMEGQMTAVGYCLLLHTLVILQQFSHHFIYASMSLFIVKDIHHMKIKLLKWYLSV